MSSEGNGMSGHSGAKFSTKDQDNDSSSSSSCAMSYKGAWWYTACHSSNLNGLYAQTGAQNHTSYADHVNWQHWRGYHYSIQFTEMKIRPHNFWSFLTAADLVCCKRSMMIFIARFLLQYDLIFNEFISFLLTIFYNYNRMTMGIWEACLSVFVGVAMIYV